MELVGKVVPRMRADGNLQWDESYPNAEVFARDVERGQLWVAEQERAIVGVAAITEDPEPDYAQAGLDVAERALVIHRLAVDPDVQRGGIARQLIAQADALARSRGIVAVRVDTNIENEATQRLFPKLGFRLAGEISLTGRPGLRFLCYEKRLGE